MFANPLNFILHSCEHRSPQQLHHFLFYQIVFICTKKSTLLGAQQSDGKGSGGKKVGRGRKGEWRICDEYREASLPSSILSISTAIGFPPQHPSPRERVLAGLDLAFCILRISAYVNE